MQRAGDMPFLKRLVKENKAALPTPEQQKIIEAGAVIRSDPKDVEATFMARHLVQCTLPHSDPGKVEAWVRRNGALTLVIQPGWDSKKNCSLGYPYGIIPRMLLFWMVTEALRTKSRTLELGPSLSAFMRQLGLIPASAGAGKRSDAKRLQDQMVRLFCCRISFEMHLQEPFRHGHWRRVMEVAPESELWWDPKEPERGVVWGSWVELGEKFYQAIITSPVPLDMRALRALKRSPLALDLYAWAAFKVWLANQKGAPQFIHWKGLMEQLGGDYDSKRIDRFKDKVKAAMRKVTAVFPGGLKLKWDRNGLTFLPGTPPAVPPAPQER